MTPDGREVRAHWEGFQALLKGGLQAGVSGIQGLANVTLETLQGMDKRLALCKIELLRLELQARAKAAFTLTEFVAAQQSFEAIVAELTVRPLADIDADLVAFAELCDAAGKAIKRVPGDRSELLRLQIQVAGQVADFSRLTCEYAEKLAEYTIRFGADALGDLVVTGDDEAFNARYSELQQQIKSDESMAAAIDLSNLDCNIGRRVSAYNAAIDRIAADLQEISSLDGLMNQMVALAESSQRQHDAELLTSGRAFLKATRSTPINLEAARAAKDNYIARLDDLMVEPVN
jgi:hypothetical protein